LACRPPELLRSASVPAPDLRAYNLERPDFFQVVALGNDFAARQGRETTKSQRHKENHTEPSWLGVFVLKVPSPCRLARHPQRARSRVAVSLGLVADGLFLAQVFGFDDDVSHGGKLL